MIMAGVAAVDRELAREVRRISLKKVKQILERPVVEMNARELDLHDQVLLRLAGGLLPRLNVLQGDEDGGPVQFKQITGMQIIPEVINANTIQDEKSETTTSS